MSAQTGALRPFRDDQTIDRAVVFLHGFSGGRDDTWANFPGLLMENPAINGWNIFTLGYATTLLPDIVGIWSADPDLTILASLFQTELAIPPLSRHRRLAVVAHSMGGLVAQKTLVDNLDLADKVSNLVLFGTPSNGLVKAGFLALWKRQLRNMARGGEFVVRLRADWDNRFRPKAPFNLTVVAGDRDQFVPPDSSLSPFDRSVCRVVPGDHLQIVKPQDAGAESYRLLCSILASHPQPAETASPSRLAAELGSTTAKPQQSVPALTQEDVVKQALALERDGDRDAAMDLLQRTLAEHPGWTDLIGTLAGRIKRIWLEHTDRTDEATRALELYRRALDIARADDDSEQIYYHAINIAFLEFVGFDNRGVARQMAELALVHCERAPSAYWNTATQAEAHLYLGDTAKALQLYGTALDMILEDWMLISSGLQASHIALKLGDKRLAEELESIFTPASRRASKIFVSYSHRDSDWLDRFNIVISPYLKTENAELELWTDTDIEPGDRWFDEITEALKRAGVVVLFVSADFLASDFIMTHELPHIMRAAEDGTIRLFWVYVSPAAIDAIKLDRFQAAHDIKRPLASLPQHERDQVLLDVACAVKGAALGATDRFTRARGVRRRTAADQCGSIR